MMTWSSRCATKFLATWSNKINSWSMTICLHIWTQIAEVKLQTLTHRATSLGEPRAVTISEIKVRDCTHLSTSILACKLSKEAIRLEIAIWMICLTITPTNRIRCNNGHLQVEMLGARKWCTRVLLTWTMPASTNSSWTAWTVTFSVSLATTQLQHLSVRWKRSWTPPVQRLVGLTQQRYTRWERPQSRPVQS